MDAHKNFAYSLVATAPSPATSGLSLIVTAGQGALFPAAPFNATVWITGANPITTNAEIIRVTAINTDTLTIVRAQEGSVARTIVIGDQIAATITAKTLNDIEGIRLTENDITVKSNRSMVVSGPLDILDGTVIDVEDGGMLEII